MTVFCELVSFGFHKMRGSSFTEEDVFDSQDTISSTKVVM